MQLWMVVVGLIAVGLLFRGTSDRIRRISEAIAVAEGYGVVGAIPTVRNNPGNIRSREGPIATYPSIESGWEALYKQVTGMVTGSSPYYPTHYTIEDVARVYTGETAYRNWSTIVSRILGVSPQSLFSRLLL